MLSNKLTFSFSLVVMLVFGLMFVATPVDAQREFQSRVIGTVTNVTDGSTLPVIGGIPDKNGFAIYEMPLGNTPDRIAMNGIISDANAVVDGTADVPAAPGAKSTTAAPITTAAAIANFPNLEELFRFGGTIEIAARKIVVDTTGESIVVTVTKPDAKDAKIGHRFVLSEVMWALDKAASTEVDRIRPQWIEFYDNYDSGADAGHTAVRDITFKPNAGGSARTITTYHQFMFIFTENQRKYRIGEKVTSTQTTPQVNAYDDTAFAETEAERLSFWVVDMVSTTDRFGGRWAEIPGENGALPKATGDGVQGANLTVEPSALVSMYRDNSLSDPEKQLGRTTYADSSFGEGDTAGAWKESTGRTNMSGYFVGTPGALQKEHLGTDLYSDKDPASLPVGDVIINEVRNDTADANLDWIELHNTGTSAVPIKKWVIDMVTAHATHTRVVEFPDADYASIPAGGYLLIVNRDPADTPLAGGINIATPANEVVEKGATHRYFVDSDLKLNNSGKFLLVLRNGNDKTNHEKIADIAGNLFITVQRDDATVGKADPGKIYRTEVWPLKGWTVPSDRDEADFGGDNTFASSSQAFARKGSGDNRLHKDHWEPVGHKGGLGYDARIDLLIAPGTPGYANDAVKGKESELSSASAQISISEIMFDAGPRWNLIQWIELYNSSMTEAVDLKDWHMEIRNKEDVASYVDSIFKFEEGAIILPNRTLLLVSGNAMNNVPRNSVYNLYEKHRTELGLEPAGRRSTLLSRTGFNLKLWEKGANRQTDTPVDEVGNVKVTGAKRNVMWPDAATMPGGLAELYDIDNADARQSLVRQYDTRVLDKDGPDDADTGTEESAWMESDIRGAGISYYGHRDDVSTPGYRLGGPLPVSLSSFRPARDKATGEVVVRWITQSELNNAGFNILRSETKNGQFKVVNVKGIVPGHGTTSEKHVYEWKDTTAKPNVVYYYQIEDVSLDGKRTLLTTTRLKGHVSAAGKVTTTWGDLKHRD